jgi:hypothetical protein
LPGPCVPPNVRASLGAVLGFNLVQHAHPPDQLPAWRWLAAPAVDAQVPPRSFIYGGPVVDLQSLSHAHVEAQAVDVSVDVDGAEDEAPTPAIVEVSSRSCSTSSSVRASCSSVSSR